MTRVLIILGILLLGSPLAANEFHVSPKGDDANRGTAERPFSTISAAAKVAMPGDTITVHAGTYRECVAPPRGGVSDSRRITYQAAPGEKVIITGSEIVKDWEQVGGDTWKVSIPNKFFGSFNPYADLIHGDWFSPQGRQHHTGAIYLNGDWLIEAANFNDVLQPAGARPLWFASVDGAAGAEYLVNIAWLKLGDGAQLPAVQTSDKNGTQSAPSSGGGQCVGFIRAGDWLRYDRVDFGVKTDNVELDVASQTQACEIEIRLDKPDGELLGKASVAATGDWQKWTSVSAKIKPTSGRKNLCLVIVPPHADGGNTTIWAQFPGVNPNEHPVEMNVRKTVFTPEKTGINYITLRGFTLRNAATNWAPPTSGQIGLVTAYWCKGWTIEDNDIAYSKCSGVALGKYSDEWDTRAGTTEGYVGTVTRALKNGWNKETVGSHMVRNNRISHCEQAGVVGSLGCAYSTVTGNEIHDIHVHQLFSGAEMAGIKFHGAIDVTISHNHIYRCGEAAALWLDWMAQGTHVTENLFHDNSGGCGDIFCEMQHGPILIANNILLSPHLSFFLNSQGIAFAHNLISAPMNSYRTDTRITPFQSAHSTKLAGMYAAATGDSGDHRFYNNLFVSPCNLHAVDGAALPCFAAGNVFTMGTQPSKFDSNALLKPTFDPGITLTEKSDGWYLTISEDQVWRNEAKCRMVTTAVLGRAKVPNVPFENADSTPLRVDTDYFGETRNAAHPFPGPFERPTGAKQTVKVWPITNGR